MPRTKSAKDTAQAVKETVDETVEAVKSVSDTAAKKAKKVTDSALKTAKEVSDSAAKAAKEVSGTAVKTAKEVIDSAVKMAKEVSINTVDKGKEALSTDVISERNVYIQYFGKQVDEKEITDRFKEAWLKVHKLSEIKSINVYYKIEDQKAYFVINDSETIEVDFF